MRERSLHILRNQRFLSRLKQVALASKIGWFYYGISSRGFFLANLYSKYKGGILSFDFLIKNL